MQPLLKVNEVVAAALEAKGVNLSLRLLALDLRLGLRVRDEELQLFEENLELFTNAALRDEQNALTVLPLFALRVLVGKGTQLILRVLLDRLSDFFLAHFAFFFFDWLLLSTAIFLVVAFGVLLDALSLFLALKPLKC